MNRTALIICVLALGLGSAPAQQAPPVPGIYRENKDIDPRMVKPSPDDAGSTAGYKAAMMAMMMNMPAFSGDADVDFMKQMRPHHQAAIDMAKVLLATGRDLETKKLAQDIVLAQEKEIALIDAWLKKRML
jgi:uncharacterized protein (DUF305 family)